MRNAFGTILETFFSQAFDMTAVKLSDENCAGEALRVLTRKTREKREKRDVARSERDPCVF